MHTYLYVLVCTDGKCLYAVVGHYARSVSSAVLLWLFCRRCDQFRPCTACMYVYVQYVTIWYSYVYIYVYTYVLTHTVNLWCLFIRTLPLALFSSSSPQFLLHTGDNFVVPLKGHRPAPDLTCEECDVCVCMCVCVCVRVYVCACVYVCVVHTYVRTYMCVLVSMCVCMHKYVHNTYSVCTYVCRCVSVWTLWLVLCSFCTKMYQYVHAYMYVHVHMYIRMYVHVCTCIGFCKIVVGNVIQLMTPLWPYFR